MVSVLFMGSPVLSAISHHAHRACILPLSHNSASRGSLLLRAAVPGAPATLDLPPTKTKPPSIRKSRKPDAADAADSSPKPFRTVGTLLSAPPAPPQQQEQDVVAKDLAAASKVSLMKWKVADLKAMLAELQQPKTGNKETLVERLLETIQQVTEGGKPTRKPARKLRKLSRADADGADGGASSRAQSPLSPAPAPAEESTSSRGRGSGKKKMSKEGMLKEGSDSRDAGGEGDGAGEGMGSTARCAAPGAEPKKHSKSASDVKLLQHSRRSGARQEGGGVPSPTQEPNSSSSSSSSSLGGGSFALNLLPQHLQDEARQGEQQWLQQKQQPPMLQEEQEQTLSLYPARSKSIPAPSSVWNSFVPSSAASAFTDASISSSTGACGITGSYIVVDPCFREQFELRAQCATPRYEAVLALLPKVYVGHVDRLPLLVELLCEEMTVSFKTCGVPLPPWRKLTSLLSKWHLA